MGCVAKGRDVFCHSSVLSVAGEKIAVRELN